MNYQGIKLVDYTELLPVSNTPSSDPDTSVSEEAPPFTHLSLKPIIEDPTLETFDPIVLSNTEGNPISV